jgi:hypothetical protein
MRILFFFLPSFLGEVAVYTKGVCMTSMPTKHHSEKFRVKKSALFRKFWNLRINSNSFELVLITSIFQWI